MVSFLQRMSYRLDGLLPLIVAASTPPHTYGTEIFVNKNLVLEKK